MTPIVYLAAALFGLWACLPFGRWLFSLKFVLNLGGFCCYVLACITPLVFLCNCVNQLQLSPALDVYVRALAAALLSLLTCTAFVLIFLAIGAISAQKERHTKSPPQSTQPSEYKDPFRNAGFCEAPRTSAALVGSPGRDQISSPTPNGQTTVSSFQLPVLTQEHSLMKAKLASLVDEISSKLTPAELVQSEQQLRDQFGRLNECLVDRISIAEPFDLMGKALWQLSFLIVDRKKELTDEAYSYRMRAHTVYGETVGNDRSDAFLMAEHARSIASALLESRRSAEAIPLLNKAIKIYGNGDFEQDSARYAINSERLSLLLQTLPMITKAHIQSGQKAEAKAYLNRTRDLFAQGGVAHVSGDVLANAKLEYGRVQSMYIDAINGLGGSN